MYLGNGRADRQAECVGEPDGRTRRERSPIARPMKFKGWRATLLVEFAVISGDGSVAELLPSASDRLLYARLGPHR
jgi:hypothetical protein